ncbi:DUF6632 domain-containing protein [Burkholderia alba]|uniref:DUF6632 domain-containing protein n=1 Tax=Burkholderia alba TaxID=2683677 RepID=UPI002B05B528|nr:DUF6632 domain-containing protein [Burkholderia alba]
MSSIHSGTPVGRRDVSPWLPLAIRLLAAGFVVFFGAAIVVVLTGLDRTLVTRPAGRLVLRLIRWGGLDGTGAHYELMISVVYVVWGVYLWRAAANPLAHRLFLDFTVVANAAHFGLMFFQGMRMPDERIHLIGDVPLGWAGLVLMAVFWLRERGKARQ